MPTECISERMEFAPVAGRAAVASFDGGTITADAGAPLLGATDRAIGLVRRFAACFVDRRAADQVEHRVATLAGRIHDLSYVALGLTLFPAILLFGGAFRRDPAWRSLSVWTWLTLALAAPAFILKGPAFYVFLAAVLVWVEVVAATLRKAGSATVSRV